MNNISNNNNNRASDDLVYWAAKPIDELCIEIDRRVGYYYQFMESAGLLRKFRKSYDLYMGYTSSSFFNSTSDVASGGEQGELSMIKVGHYRNLIQHMLVLTTASRPTLEAHATNTDMKSKAQTILANGILEYYLREKRLERLLKTACEHSLIWGEGYIHMSWDVNAGAPYGKDPVTGKTVNEGDISYKNPQGPMDVVRDVSVQNYNDSQWFTVIERVNRFDLMAKYPTKAMEINQIRPSAMDSFYNYMPPGIPYDNTTIALKIFYHKKTDSMPNGRMVHCLSDSCWLFDGPLPYSELPGGIPLFRMSPGEFYGTPFGYSSAWDIIGLSEVNDSLYSVVVTNQTSFGVQNVLTPKGGDIAYQQLTGGLNLIEYDPKLGKPESLNLTHTPPEIFKFIEHIEKTEGLLLGINDVIRGEPQASLKSGSALALVASQSIQFNSGLQASYIALLEDTGTGTIRMLQSFANTKRVASIAGRRAQYMLKEFSSNDLSEINRVVVDVANPLSRTISGRLEMAKDLLQIPGVIKHADQYIQLLETGSYRSLTQGPEDELLSIDSENEQILDGQEPVAILTDDHALHIREHKFSLATQDSRKDPKVVQAAMSHIQKHIDLLSNTDPRILMMTGQQPIPQPPPPQGAPGQQPQPSMQGPNPAQPQHPPLGSNPMQPPNPKFSKAPLEGISNVANPTSPTEAKVQGVREAKLPRNPLSGNRFNPTPNPTGGGPQE